MAVRYPVSVNRLREAFIQNIRDQKAYMQAGSSEKGNRCVKRYISSAKAMLEHGDEGISTLACLLHHEDIDVRVLTACILLKYRTKESLAVLEADAKGDSLAAYGAAITLKRWRDDGVAPDF